MDEREIKVKVRNLTKCFGDLKVLDDISFDVKKGDFLCRYSDSDTGWTILEMLRW